jgi:sporulation protein YlmC with PRC-barrel domain
MNLKKLIAFCSVLLVAALLLAACMPEEQAESPTFPEPATPQPGEGQFLLPTSPVEAPPPDPLEITPPVATAEATPQATPEAAPEGGTDPALATPQETGTPGAGGPPSSSGAIILPDTGRAELTRLSELVGYQVIDLEGQALGTASDYLINLCEAHLLYVVLDPDPALQVEEGRQVLIPYEIISLHSGTLNSQERTIQLNLDRSAVQGAPSFEREGLDLTGNEWEPEVQEFWAAHGNLSLTSECRVPGVTTGTAGEGSGTAALASGAISNCTGADPHPRGQQLAETYSAGYDEIMGWFCEHRLGFGEIDWGYELSRENEVPVEDIFALRSNGMGWGNIRNAVAEGNVPAAPEPVQDRVTIFKNAFASEVLGASVVDGNRQPLGTVEEVILEPESGRLTFYAVRLGADLQADQNLVLAPPGALNLENDPATGEVTLVLLVETNVLVEAPQAGSLPAPGDTGLEAQALDYWGQFVPLTREELP